MLCSSARGRRRARSVTGVHGDELRMVRGITVQHPAQIIGGQRRFAARKISAGDLSVATTAQLRRGVPRLARRFDLQWGTAWGMFRRVWGCSPREKSDQDGLDEEIDDALFFGGRKKKGSICGWCARRRAVDGARRHGAAPRSNYRRPKTVRGEKNFGRRSVRADDGTATSWSSKADRTIRPAVGHGSAVDCGGWPAVGRARGRRRAACYLSAGGVTSSLLKSGMLSARRVFSRSAATRLSPAARRQPQSGSVAFSFGQG